MSGTAVNVRAGARSRWANVFAGGFVILIGVALSFLLQILRMSNRVEVRELELVEGGFPIERPAPRVLGPASPTRASR